MQLPDQFQTGSNHRRGYDVVDEEGAGVREEDALPVELWMYLDHYLGLSFFHFLFLFLIFNYLPGCF